jgi:hypothetical protein
MGVGGHDQGSSYKRTSERYGLWTASTSIRLPTYKDSNKNTNKLKTHIPLMSCPCL